MNQKTSAQYVPASITDRRDIVPHAIINIALNELRYKNQRHLPDQLRRILRQNRVQQAEILNDGTLTSGRYFQVDLEQWELDEICNYFKACANRFRDSEERSSYFSFYSSLADQWAAIPPRE